MTARTHEQFLIDLEERQPNVFALYTIVGEYKSNHEKIEVKCNKCGITAFKTPSKLLTGRGCQSCRFLSKDEIASRLSELYPSWVFDLSSVVNVQSEVTCICDKGHKSVKKLRKLLEGSGCQECAIDSQRRPAALLEKLKEWPHVSWVGGEYINCKNKLIFECERHGLFKANADSMLNKYVKGCPECAKDNMKFHNLTLAHRNKDDYLKLDTNVYVVHIKGIGYKVGIAKDCSSRFSSISRESGCETSSIREYSTNLYRAILIEDAILNHFKRKTIPPTFAGYTEVLDAELEDILAFMELKVNDQ